MYTTTPDPTNRATDRIRRAAARSRLAAAGGALIVLAATGIAAGALTPTGLPIGNGPASTADQALPGLSTGIGSDTGSGRDTGPDGSVDDGSDPLGGVGGSAPAGEPGGDSGGSDGGSGEASGGSDDSGGSTPSEPANRPPTITDVEVEGSGMTVVVRYRVDDPDGDPVATDVAFGRTGRTGAGQIAEAPTGELSGETGGSGGTGGSPGRTDLPIDPAGELVDTIDLPRPLGDGRYEIRHTYERRPVTGPDLARITIDATDGRGGEARRTAQVELEAIDRITLSEVRYEIPDPVCFSDRIARRLFGNIDLQGAIESRRAISEELRLDRRTVTLEAERTVEVAAGVPLTVSFQPAMESVELTTHVVTHTDDATVETPIGRGRCAGLLSYTVSVTPV